MLYLDKKVKDMKAWQLYLGNAIFTLLVSIFMVIIVRVLKIFHINNSTLGEVVKTTGNVIRQR